jgi:hypothetical protein
MSDQSAPKRRFFHSFPRPKKDEPPHLVLARGLKILDLMKQVGLVLAPEVVSWDLSVIRPGGKPLGILQRRASFTELDVSELPGHSAVFGPISLSFDVAKLRDAGATPVIYVPQGTADSPLSHIATFCVNGVHHTKYVLSFLHQLKEASDPARLSQRLNMPVSPNFELPLRNTGPDGSVIAEYKFGASTVRDFLQYIGFNNIPFDHSAAVLGFLLNLFYPTDNTYKNDQLGYYRQREWRLIYSDLAVKGRPVGRKLSSPEIAKLEEIDPEFWSRELVVDGVRQRRSALALVFDPVPGWDFFELAEEILVPERAIDQVRAIVGEKIATCALG